MGTQSSLAVGWVAGMLLASSLAVVLVSQAMAPWTLKEDPPIVSANIWTPGSEAMRAIPLARPILHPRLYRTPEASIIVQSELGSDPQRLDPSVWRFVPMASEGTKPPTMEGPAQSPNERTIPVVGEGAMWLVVASGGATHWSSGGAGPSLPSGSGGYDTAVALDDARIALLEDGTSTGQTALSILTARRSDARFLPIDTHPAVAGYLVAAAPAGGSRILVVVTGTPGGGSFTPDKNVFSTHLIDVVSGAVSAGPPIPGLHPQEPVTQSSSAFLGDGTLVLIASQATAARHWNPQATPAAAAAALLAALVGLMFATLRSRQVVRARAAAGFFAGFGVVGLGTIVLLALAILGTAPR